MAGSRWMLAAIAIVGCNAFGAGEGTGVGDSTTPSSETGPKVGGQSGAEGGCAQIVDAPPNVEFEQPVAELGFSAADVTAAVAGRHSIEAVWGPWFEAPSSRRMKRRFTLEITPGTSARRLACSQELDVTADVRLTDESTAITIELSGKLLAFGSDDADPHLSEVALIERFDSPELAKALALPPAAEQGQDADGFELYASHTSAGWTLGLSSVRNGNSCRVFDVAPSTSNVCDGYADLISDSPVARTALSAEFGGGRIDDVLEAVRAVGAVEMLWKDGSATTLTIEATAADFACTGQLAGEGGASDAPGADAGSSAIDVVLVPLQLHLTTKDGKLDATLPAIVRAIASGGAWDGRADLGSALVPFAMLTATDWRPILPPRAGAIAFASLSMTLPLTAESSSRMWFAAYDLYAGVPDFPAVQEYASNRIGCFSNGEPVSSSYEAALRPLSK